MSHGQESYASLRKSFDIYVVDQQYASSMSSTHKSQNRARKLAQIFDPNGTSFNYFHAISKAVLNIAFFNRIFKRTAK